MKEGKMIVVKSVYRPRILGALLFGALLATIGIGMSRTAAVVMASPIAGTISHAAVHAPQKPVYLGNAALFTILTKSGITDVYPSVINGTVGTSPITGAAIHLRCTEVQGGGKVYSVNAAGPLPCRITDPKLLTSAVSDMQIGYANAAARTNPDFTELGAGQIGGLTLQPGLYKWSTNVLISKNVTLSGSSTDVWVFQIAGTLTQASATKVILKGGAVAKNIFWQTAGGVTIGTTAHFEGVLLAKTLIAFKTGASANSRLLAQTAVTLEQNAVTRPPY